MDLANEQMVFGEATINMPLVVGYAHHSGAWKEREEMRLGRMLDAW